MDELREIIDKYTEGNYLISESDKEKMSEDILNLLSVKKCQHDEGYTWASKGGVSKLSAVNFRNMNKEVLKFMAAFFAEKEAWVSNDIEIPKDTDGFEFKHKNGIKGLIVFGKSYPLSNQDVSIDEHLKVWDSIKSVENHGILFNNVKGGQKMYRSSNGEIMFL